MASMEPPEVDAATETTIKVPQDTTVESVTVFVDRAEVVRTVEFKPDQAGLHHVMLRGLTNKANKDSIRVKGKAGSPGQLCTILEVACEVSHKPLDDDAEAASSAESAARATLKAAQRTVTELDTEMERLEQQDKFVQSYVGSMLSATKPDVGGPPGSSPGLIAPAVGSDLKAVASLLDFHAERCAKADAAKFELKDRIAAAKREVDAARSALQQITRLGAVAAGGVKSHKEVTISLNVPHDAVSATAPVQLMLTYVCSNASWTPTYDVRADLGEAKAGASPSLNLSYFGVVQQSTGEDWTSVHLNLSTASPATGGSPPAPPTRRAQFKISSYGGPPVQRNTLSRRERNSRLHIRSHMPQQAMSSNMMMPMQAMMPPSLDREDSCEALEVDMESGSEEEERLAAEERRAPPATAAVKSKGAGAANFIIQRLATIASDNKEHKVTIAMLELVPTLRHFCTPELEEHTYLQCTSVNTSSYPLLESDRVAVFFDGTFVATSHMKEVNPGDKLTVFLGVDPTVKIEQKLIKESANEGEGGGLFQRATKSRLLFEHRTLLHNTKLERPVDITVVQLFPRSNDDKIKVELLAPDPRQVATTGDGGAAGTSATGAGTLRSGGVMKNKITNNIVFSCTIAPQEKLELPFSYSVSWPPESERGVEVV